MALTRWDDDEIFAHPFRAMLDPRLLGPSLLTAPAKADDLAAIRVDVLEVRIRLLNLWRQLGTPFCCRKICFKTQEELEYVDFCETWLCLQFETSLLIAEG